MTSLGGVVASSSCPWGQHIGALTGLLILGAPAILHSLTPIARPYHARLTHAISQSSITTSRDIHDAHTTNCLLLVSILKCVRIQVLAIQVYTGVIWFVFSLILVHSK